MNSIVEINYYCNLVCLWFLPRKGLRRTTRNDFVAVFKKHRARCKVVPVLIWISPWPFQVVSLRSCRSGHVVLGLNRSFSNLAVPRVRFVYFLELAHENQGEIDYIQSREPKYERSRRRRWVQKSAILIVLWTRGQRKLKTTEFLKISLFWQHKNWSKVSLRPHGQVRATGSALAPVIVQ